MTDKSLYRLLIHDFKYSLSYGKYKFLVFYGVIVILAILFSLQQKDLTGNSVTVIFSLLKDEGYFYQLSDYILPFNWAFIQICTLFLISDYLFFDQENNKNYLLLRAHSKKNYITSKLIWIVIQNILIFTLLFFTIYLVSSLVTEDFSLNRSVYVNHSIVESAISPGQLVLRLLTGYMITGIVLSSILLLAMQYLLPVLSFLSVVILCSLSTFLDTKWLPAIHSMILKQDIFNNEHHFTLTFSVIYSMVVYIIVSIITLNVFKRKEFL